MRITPLALLLAACSGDGSPTDPKTGDSGTPTATPTTTGTASGAASTPSEVGHLVYWSEDGGVGLQGQHLLATFAPHFDGLAAPAPCGAKGHLCVAELPSAVGSFIDATPTTYDAFATPASWVGNTMDVGGHQLLFTVDPDTGFGVYTKEIGGSNVAAMDVRLTGEWGEWTGPQVLPVGDYLEGLDPEAGAFLLGNGGIDLEWTPGTGSGIAYVRVASPSFDRIWRFPDLGSASIPVAELEGLVTGEQADYHFYRVEQTATHDVNGNTLTTEVWSSASYLAGRSEHPPSCKAILDADPTAQNGIHTIQPNPLSPAVEVFCDMATDGGGWTLVSSTSDPVDDIADSWSENLTTLSPSSPMIGIWHGMRFPITGQSDIRFACKVSRTAPVMDVDLSFYEVGWYREISKGPYDIGSCFFQLDGWGAPPPPQRRNNLTGEVLPAGDQWEAGYLEGEDTCDDWSDFTIDFDDRGMNGNEVDGTDWGEDDDFHKCGTQNNVTSGGAWFIFVRE